MQPDARDRESVRGFRTKGDSGMECTATHLANEWVLHAFAVQPSKRQH